MDKTKIVLIHLYIAAIVSLLFMLAEIIGAFLSGSLAILNDAFYILSDILSFCISIITIHISNSEVSSDIKANRKLTFGYHRAEILGALISMLIIFGLTIMIICMSVQRIISPVEIDGFIMLIYAIAGLIANISVGLLLANSYRYLHKESPNIENPRSQTPEDITSYSEEKDLKPDNENRHNDRNQADNITVKTIDTRGTCQKEHRDDNATENTRLVNECKNGTEEIHESDCFLLGSDNDETDLNIRAGIIHMVSDSIQSIGVIVASVIIYNDSSLVIFDPLCTLLFSLVALGTTYPVLKDCLRILMQAIPKGYDNDNIINDLKIFADIINVHDVHIWSINHEKVAFSCHLVSTANKKEVLNRSFKILKEKYKLDYITLQVEQECFFEGNKCESFNS